MPKIAYVVIPGFQVMVFAGMSVFELANAALGKPHYEISMLSETGGPVTNSLGMAVGTRPLKGRFDTVIAAAGLGVVPSAPAVEAFLKRSARTSRRVASVCSGAFVLANAGLLDHRRVTTHWAYARELQKRFPKVKVDEDRIFVVDGPVWTSAGMTAGIDMALGMVEQDLGVELARLLAKKLVVPQRRSGGQLQHSVLLDMDARSDRIQGALAFARSHLQAPLTVEQLAGQAHLSPRQFSRAFRAETGHSPAKAVENLRVEAARLMMEQGRHPIEVVARETGFADRERMRRAFLRALGQPPQVIRRNARLAAAA